MFVHSDDYSDDDSEENYNEESGLLSSRNYRRFSLCFLISLSMLVFLLIIVIGVKFLKYAYPKGPPQLGY